MAKTFVLAKLDLTYCQRLLFTLMTK